MAQSYVTTRGRRLVSVLIGSAVGSLLTTVALLMLPGAGERLGDVATTLLACFILFFIMWMLALGLLALPFWLIAEWRGWRISWRRAVMCGAILAPILFVSILVSIFALAIQSPLLWGPVAIVAAAFVVIGGLVALSMWRYAYRRVVPVDVADAFS